MSVSSYAIFNADDALQFAKKYVASAPSRFPPAEGVGGGAAFSDSLTIAEEVGDGNLNLVFKIYGEDRKSRMIVKQALPYVRCVGTSWPLTTDRARLEAITLMAHHAACPAHTVEVLYIDESLAAFILEDLSDYTIWRGEMLKDVEAYAAAGHTGDSGRGDASKKELSQNSGACQVQRILRPSAVRFPDATRQLALYAATVLFRTSDFVLGSLEKKTLVARHTNTEMCRISEELFFEDPFVAHPRNNYGSDDRMRAAVEAGIVVPFLRIRDGSDDGCGDRANEGGESPLPSNMALHVAVARLRHTFLSSAEALLHGDLHTGSIFVREDSASSSSSLKVIDGEFGFFGPIGFDVGTVLGNLLLNFCAAKAQSLSSASKATQAAGSSTTKQSEILCQQSRQRLSDAVQFWNVFANEFIRLAKCLSRDEEQRPAQTQISSSSSAATVAYVEWFIRDKVWRDAVGFCGTELIRRAVGLSHVADISTIADAATRILATEHAVRLGRFLIASAESLKTSECFEKAIAGEAYMKR